MQLTLIWSPQNHVSEEKEDKDCDDLDRIRKVLVIADHCQSIQQKYVDKIDGNITAFAVRQSLQTHPTAFLNYKKLALKEEDKTGNEDHHQ